MNQSQRMKRVMADPAMKAHLRKTTLRSWADPEVRARRSSGMRRHHQANRAKWELARARGAAKHRAALDALVAEMFALYQSGASLSEVARRFNRKTPGQVSGLFSIRGYPLRHDATRVIEHNADGTWKARRRLTAKDVAELIAGETKLRVPPELKTEWREWSLEQRGDFMRRLRAKLNTGRDRPETPFSANVEPFDYASPRAWEICNAANRGTSSRNAVVKMTISSQGVIWDGALWFWTWRTGYLRMGQWTPEAPRQLLNWAVWEKANGRKVPRKGYIVVFADGNPNNFAPENLLLKKRETELRENQAAALARKSRELTATLLKRSQKKGPDHGNRDPGLLEAVQSSAQKPRRAGS